MAAPGAPAGLSVGGRALWNGLRYDGMPADERAILTEACRARDRLDKLDKVLRGDTATWVSITTDEYGEPVELTVDKALGAANATATNMRLLLAQLPAAVPAAGSGTAPAAPTKPSGGGTPLDQLEERRQQRTGGGAASTTRARTAQRRRPRK